MLWLQAAVCFCAWIGYGVILARTERARSLLPAKRVAAGWGALALIAGMLLLVASLFGVATFGGLQQGALTLWGWIIVLFGGAAFVHLQCAGALILFRAAIQRETSPSTQTSVPSEDPS